MRGVKAANRRAARCRLGQTQQHQNRGRLPSAIWTEEAEYLTLFNGEIERVDGELIVVALRETIGLDDGAHLRPSRKKTAANPITTKPTIPKPTQPQIVGVETVILNSADLVISPEVAVTRSAESPALVLSGARISTLISR